MTESTSTTSDYSLSLSEEEVSKKLSDIGNQKHEEFKSMRILLLKMSTMVDIDDNVADNKARQYQDTAKRMSKKLDELHKHMEKIVIRLQEENYVKDEINQTLQRQLTMAKVLLDDHNIKINKDEEGAAILFDNHRQEATTTAEADNTTYYSSSSIHHEDVVHHPQPPLFDDDEDQGKPKSPRGVREVQNEDNLPTYDKLKMMHDFLAGPEQEQQSTTDFPDDDDDDHDELPSV